MASTNLKTTHVFTLRATLELGQTVGQTLSGIRIFVPVSGGTLKGPDIEAEILYAAPPPHSSTAPLIHSSSESSDSA
ncbi:hypothetical protein SAICODRAFT_31131 [Saitoella complicata NRRL Y-17804]|uniref:uncharacterized protein n=1 Tax=Saitoella complicata (strain BCRC 22490 / CBS 7301 / JCM 7358 / NBRC 10748 / NRRL Y-17804) TaxID=698492 RepID=UPI00086735A4|nr:uncharacterized protein SAICODRAFT_31131 [Saitoella complicata NRRL Y-17804]ODQ51788.1 hypothetical protein SAICODRAFT_31131 [Saitoella complicata NRRL Y-17804]